VTKHERAVIKAATTLRNTMYHKNWEAATVKVFNAVVKMQEARRVAAKKAK
jgi:hypothetical protein